MEELAPDSTREGVPERVVQATISLLAELKMIRSLQIRVNTRTTSYGKQYPGEQADDTEIQKELRNLAQRQDKIQKATKDIAGSALERWRALRTGEAFAAFRAAEDRADAAQDALATRRNS